MRRTSDVITLSDHATVDALSLMRQPRPWLEPELQSRCSRDTLCVSIARQGAKHHDRLGMTRSSNCKDLQTFSLSCSQQQGSESHPPITSSSSSATLQQELLLQLPAATLGTAAEFQVSSTSTFTWFDISSLHMVSPHYSSSFTLPQYSFCDKFSMPWTDFTCMSGASNLYASMHPDPQARMYYACACSHCTKGSQAM